MYCIYPPAMWNASSACGSRRLMIGIPQNQNKKPRTIKKYIFAVVEKPHDVRAADKEMDGNPTFLHSRLETLQQSQMATSFKFKNASKNCPSSK